VKDVRHRRAGDPESLGDHSVRDSFAKLAPDLADLVSRQFGSGVLLSPGASQLARHVGVVSRVVTQEEVSGIHARRVVAAVENVPLAGILSRE
jgi:hypothetical protein